MISRSPVAALLIAFVAGSAACDQLPLLAPTGSTVTIVAAATTLAPAGATEVSATVLEASGTPVQNGTLVTFTATLGQLDPREARTHNGTASVMLRGTGESGIAKVIASSGGAKSAELEVRIGAAAAERVTLSASPGTVAPTGGTVTLIATVTDANGRGLVGIAVNFSASAGTLSATSAITDANGDARVTLTTIQQASITARAGSKESPALTVSVRAATGITVTANPGSTTANSTVIITVAPSPTGTVLRNVRLEYGDGDRDDLGTITAATSLPHLYRNDGTFRVRASGIDPSGEGVENATTVVVLPRPPLDVTITASPNPGREGQVTTLTASVTPLDAAVTSYRWNFGDGIEESGGRVKTHVFQSPKIYRVTVFVTTQDGRSQTGELHLRID